MGVGTITGEARQLWSQADRAVSSCMALRTFLHDFSPVSLGGTSTCPRVRMNGNPLCDT